MDDLTSLELIDNPQLEIPIHTLYSCCLDTLKSISLVALPDERFKTYHARLKIWGAGLFTEGPSLDEILEEEPKRYGPLLISLQKTLFSIAVEEVVFLKSRQALDGNYDTDLQLEPQTKRLLDLVSEDHIAISACDRRLPHLVNTSKIGTIEPLTLQSVSTPDLTPSSSNQIRGRKDRSLTSQGASLGFINRLSKKLPAANEVIGLFTKKEDAVDRVRAASPLLGEHGLREDYNASLRQPSEVCHGDYDMYLGDFIESLFDLLPSIRGIRRTRLLETEFHQSNERSSSSDLVKQVTSQSARNLPEPGIQSDGDITGSQNLKRPRPLQPSSFPSSTVNSLMLKFSIIGSHKFASEIHDRCFKKAHDADDSYLRFGREILALGTGLQELERIIDNTEVQIPDDLWGLDGANTMATIFNTLLEVIGDFRRTLDDCQELLSDKLIFQRSATGFVENVLRLTSVRTAVNDLRQRVNLHATKISFIAKPFELRLLLGIHNELRQVKKDVAPLKGILIQDTAQSVHPKRPQYRNGRGNVLPDLAKRFEKASATSSPDSVQAWDHLSLREGFDALVFHLANSMVESKPVSGIGQNIPRETQFVDLLKSRWIMEKLKGSDYLQSAGSESLWADCIRELEDTISDQESRFETGELEQPTPNDIARLPDRCFAIWVHEGPLHRPAVLAEQRPSGDKILELALPSADYNQRSTLAVFRERDLAFTLVSTTKDELRPGFRFENIVEVDMNSTRFIPAFATPDPGGPINNRVLLCNGRGQHRKYHTFEDSSAIAEFQRALLGYRVLNYTSNISWHIGFSKFGQKAISGKARLQLWQLKPLPNLLPSLESTALVGSGSSVGGSVQSPTLSSLPLSDSTAATSMTGSRGDGVALARPEPPVLVIFTMCESKYTFFHIKIESGLSAKPQTCSKCQDQNKTCSGVLIKSSSKEWNFRRLSAQLDNREGLFSWDLACFKYPEHPAFQNLERLTKVKYMSLHFETTDESEVFLADFESLERLRDTEILDHDLTLKEMKYMATYHRQR